MPGNFQTAKSGDGVQPLALRMSGLGTLALSSHGVSSLPSQPGEIPPVQSAESGVVLHLS